MGRIEAIEECWERMVLGSLDAWQLVQELIESDLVDQVNLMVFPLILGTGRRYRGEARTARPAAQGIEGSRRGRRRADLGAGRLRGRGARGAPAEAARCHAAGTGRGQDR